MVWDMLAGDIVELMGGSWMFCSWCSWINSSFVLKLREISPRQGLWLRPFIEMPLVDVPVVTKRSYWPYRCYIVG